MAGIVECVAGPSPGPFLSSSFIYMAPSFFLSVVGPATSCDERFCIIDAWEARKTFQSLNELMNLEVPVPVKQKSSTQTDY